MTGGTDWSSIPAPGGGIMGVKSRSVAKSIRTLKDASRYSEWQFVYEPPAAPETTSQVLVEPRRGEDIESARQSSGAYSDAS